MPSSPSRTSVPILEHAFHSVKGAAPSSHEEVWTAPYNAQRACDGGSCTPSGFNRRCRSSGDTWISALLCETVPRGVLSLSGHTADRRRRPAGARASGQGQLSGGGVGLCAGGAPEYRGQCPRTWPAPSAGRGTVRRDVLARWAPSALVGFLPRAGKVTLASSSAPGRQRNATRGAFRL